MHSSLKEFDAWAAQWREEKDIPGLVVCAHGNNGTVFENAYGFHDKETGQSLQTSMIFPIASLSKTFTALAIVQLAEAGKLSLDDKITDHLPQLKVDWLEGKTLRDALAHRTRMTGGEAQLLSSEELRNIPIASITPSKWPGYSNRMYNRLGLIIEDVSGMSFSDYVRTQIVERYDLGEIYPGLNAIPVSAQARIPTGYTGENLDVPVAREANGAATTPSGGFYATPGAVTAFYHRLATGTILPGHAFDMSGGAGMFGKENQGSGWAGFGIMIQPLAELDNVGQRNLYHFPGAQGEIAGHTGSLNGFICEVRHNPSTGITTGVFRTGYNVPDWVSDPERLQEFRKLQADDAASRGTPIVMSKFLEQTAGFEAKVTLEGPERSRRHPATANAPQAARPQA